MAVFFPVRQLGEAVSVNHTGPCSPTSSSDYITGLQKIRKNLYMNSND